MSTGTPDPADPDPNATSCTLVSTKSSGAHVLTVESYSATKQLVPTGSHLSSDSFPAGRYSTWHLTYYPNGATAENSGHASFFLVLNGTAPKATVVADFTISLLDEAGAPVPGHSKSIRRHEFAGDDNHGLLYQYHQWWAGFPEFLGTEELEGSGHLRDDRFSVRCDVVVFETRTVSGLYPRLPEEHLVADGGTTASVAVPGTPCCLQLDGREEMFTLDELVVNNGWPCWNESTVQVLKDGDCLMM